jgi:YVTN family beta-propeller protein
LIAAVTTLALAWLAAPEPTLALNAYIANSGDNTVSVIDEATNTVVTNVGANPFGVAATPDGSRVYVTNQGGDSVSVIDTATNMVIGTIHGVGPEPTGVAVTPDCSKVYVANRGSDSVSVIDTATNTVETITVGLLPIGVVVAPDGSKVYVTKESDNTVSVITTASDPRFFKICKNQTYALCAVANCFVLDGLSYCKCDVMSGDSISLPFNYDDNQDICSINAAGVENGYMASTFSTPPSVEPPNGDMALYDCPRTSVGAYAQCDGGLCFASTEGKSFPGFEGPLKQNEIICSCPITQPTSPPPPVGFRIAGPYPCQSSHFQYCNIANPKTGSTIYVGAPTGAAALLSKLLYGKVSKFNRCPQAH